MPQGAEKIKKCFINKKYYCLNFLKIGTLAILINLISSPTDKFNYKVSIYYRYRFLFNVPFWYCLCPSFYLNILLAPIKMEMSAENTDWKTTTTKHFLKHFLSTRWVIKMIGDYCKHYIITKLNFKWSIKWNNLSSFYLTANSVKTILSKMSLKTDKNLFSTVDL